MIVSVEVPDDAGPGQHGVYVLYDAAGEVLYIGRSRNLAQRLKMHRGKGAAWWPALRSIEWTLCVDAVTARLVERDMIETFTPGGNTNDTHTLHSPRLAIDTDAALILHELRCAAAEVNYGSTPENDRFRAYVAALRATGWSLAAIGLPLGVTREYVRQLALDAPAVADLPPVPAPVRVERARRPLLRDSLPRISDERAADLRRLHAVCRTVNGGTAADDPRREASVRFTEMVAEDYARGVPVRWIANAVGVTPYAIKARLARHGYTEAAPSVADQRYIGRPAARTVPSDTCRRNHQLSGDNLRITVPGGVRVCVACERIHAANYRARKRTAA